MENIMIYMTAPEGEAEKISEALVEKRLVACANILAPHKAVYRWGGKVERGEERAVIFKTRAELFEKVREDICALHSYECPCIVSWPITQGHEPFLDWIGLETSGLKE